MYDNLDCDVACAFVCHGGVPTYTPPIVLVHKARIPHRGLCIYNTPRVTRDVYAPSHPAPPQRSHINDSLSLEDRIHSHLG